MIRPLSVPKSLPGGMPNKSPISDDCTSNEGEEKKKNLAQTRRRSWIWSFIDNN